MDGQNSYYVVWPDGRRFGPAEMSVLQTWASEQRILADTILENAATGEQFTAGSIGLGSPAVRSQPAPSAPQDWAPHQAMPQSGPTQGGFQVPEEYPLSTGSPYPVQSYYAKGRSDLSTAWGLIIGGFVSLFLTLCCSIGILAAPALTSVGIYYANKAKKAGEQGAQAAMVTGIIVLCLIVMLVIGYIVFIAAMMTSGFRGTFRP